MRNGTAANDIITAKLAFQKETTIVKRVLFVLGVAVLFLNTLVVPTSARADVSGGGTNCGGTLCKP